MEAVLAGVIAVLGTLLGSGVTHSFQRRALERTEEFARRERLRQERIVTYTTYGGALLSYRRTLVNRWYAEHDRPDKTDLLAVRLHSYDIRTSTQEALFKLQLLSDDPALIAHARRVFGTIDDLHHTEDRAVLNQRRAATRALVYDFIEACAPHVR